MAPEFQVIALVTAVYAVVYIGLYGRLADKSLRKLMQWDVVIGVLLLGSVGVLFAGKGVGFSLLVISVPWWVFTLVISLIVELPLFIWFCRKWDIDLGDPD